MLTPAARCSTLRLMPTTQPRKTGHKHVVQVDVTQDVIISATVRDSSHCMIADAIKARHPDMSMISVDLATIRFTDRKVGRRYVYLTPPVAQRALVNFDQGIPSEPFVFTLRRAAQVYDAAVRGKRSRKREPAKNTGGTNVPTLVGGIPLPVGPIAAGPSHPSPSERKARVEKKLATARPNESLAASPGRIRAFGLRQLRP